MAKTEEGAVASVMEPVNRTTKFTDSSCVVGLTKSKGELTELLWRSPVAAGEEGYTNFMEHTEAEVVAAVAASKTTAKTTARLRILHEIDVWNPVSPGTAPVKMPTKEAAAC